MLNKPCLHTDPHPGCRVCWLAEHDHRYRTLYGGGARLPCRHLGGPIDGPKRQALGLDHVRDWRDCGMGKGVVCACGACGSCDAYESPAAEPTVPSFTTRNLLFHLMPIPGQWQWHAEQIRKRADLFNGRRVVAVVERERLDPVRDVAAALPGCEIISFPNDPTRRELVSFEALFGSLAADDSCTLYAQGKGVTHGGDRVFRRWAEILWESLTDYWPAVDDTLRRHPVAGSFRKVGAGWHPSESASDWHYSGSWFWFRNRDVFSLADWKRIDPVWFGIESYPSLHFRVWQAGTVFHTARVPVLDFYDGGKYLDGTIEPEWARWKQQHAEEHVAWG